MASRLIIQNVTGTTPYDVYVCDLLEVLCSYVGVLSGATLGQVFYLPSLYDTAPIIVAKLIDSNGCEIKKQIMCDEDCTFQVVLYDQSGYPCLFTPTPSQTPTNTPTPSITPSITPTQTETPTSTPSETPTSTPTVTPTLTPTETTTVTPTETPTSTPTETPTSTPTETPTETPTSTPTVTPTLTPVACDLDVTILPSATPTQTPTNTPTNTPTVTASETPTNTPTPSVTPTITTSETPTNTPTPTVTPSITSSETPTPTVTPSVTPTITSSETPTNTPTPTVTPSVTSTITPSVTPTPTVTSSVTPTITPTVTSSVTPTITPTVTPTPTQAIVPSDPTLEIYYQGGVASSANFNPVPSSGSTFTQWKDSSASAHNANPIGGGSGPSPEWWGNVQNGLGGVYFNGTSDGLSVNPLTDLSSKSGQTIVLVAKTLNIGTTQQYIQAGEDGNTGLDATYIRQSGGTYNVAIAGGFATGGTVNNNPHIISLVFDGTGATNSDKLKLYIDNSLQTLSFTSNVGNTTSSLVDYIFLGVSYTSVPAGSEQFFYNGFLFDVLVYSKTLSSSELLTINQYLSNKWNIPLI